MGKVKSTIITALLVAAIIVLALFATISCTVPGSNGVERYNSFISSIPLGSELTGDASVILYPAGVITEAEYERTLQTYQAIEDADKKAEKIEEYQAKYEHIEKAGLYVEKDKLTDDNNNDISCEFAASVKKDAEIISDRLSKKGYSSYSVAVVDTYGIKITVPTGFSYAAYKGYNSTEQEAALSAIGNTMSYLSLDGGLSVRSSSTYADNNAIYKELDKDNPYSFNSFFKSAQLYSRGGIYALRINLTDEGFEEFNKILTNTDASTVYLYAGETNLALTFTGGSEITEKSMYFQANKSNSQDYAILIDSIVKGNMLTNKYNENNDAALISLTPAYGEYAAVCLAVLVLVVILAAAVLPIIKYKKLGLVNAIMVCAYSVAITTAILLTGTQLTIGGIFTALLGLALLCFSNFFTFEAVRKETALGRTINASVQLGYKKSMFGVLDVHAVLVIAAILMALVGAGELAACGLIFFIATIASFALYWFTRFMWYVISSPVRNKFAFCGFVREVEDDD